MVTEPVSKYLYSLVVTTPTHVEWTGVHVAHSDVDL